MVAPQARSASQVCAARGRATGWLKRRDDNLENQQRASKRVNGPDVETALQLVKKKKKTRAPGRWAEGKPGRPGHVGAPGPALARAVPAAVLPCLPTAYEPLPTARGPACAVPPGFSVDWWALGVLMFEMMAGRSPFDIITDNPDMNTEDYLFQGAWATRCLPRLQVPPPGLCVRVSPYPPVPHKQGRPIPTHLLSGKQGPGWGSGSGCGVGGQFTGKDSLS